MGAGRQIDAASEHLFWMKLGKFHSSFTFQIFTLSQGASGQAFRNINCKLNHCTHVGYEKEETLSSNLSSVFCQ